MRVDVLPLDRPEVQHGVEIAPVGEGRFLLGAAVVALILEENIDRDRFVIRPKQFIQVFATCRE